MKGYKKYIVKDCYGMENPYYKYVRKWVVHLFGKLGKTYVFVQRESKSKTVYYMILTKRNPYPIARRLLLDGLISDIWPAK